MLSTPLVNIFGFFNVGLFDHSMLFVSLGLLLTSILYKPLYGGRWGGGPKGDESNMAKKRVLAGRVVTYSAEISMYSSRIYQSVLDHGLKLKACSWGQRSACHRAEPDLGPN